MLLPIPELQILSGATSEWTTQSQIRGIPKRLLIEQSVTPYLRIEDIRIGNSSYTAACGVIPADAFAIDGSLLEKALKSGRVHFEEDLKLELPIVDATRFISVRITNISPNIMTVRGAWELITADDDDPRMVTEIDRRPSCLFGGDTITAISYDGLMWQFVNGAWKHLPSLPMTTKAALKSQEG